MTKTQLVKEVARRYGVRRVVAARVVNTLFDTMAEALCEGRRIEIRGFGTFSVRSYDAYTGRNPRTGEPVEVAPKRLPAFKMGKDIRERLNQE